MVMPLVMFRIFPDAVALVLAYLLPSRLIYAIAGFVWAGVGGTFSAVVLLALFWRRYHGRAVLCTIVGGSIFAVVWQTAGMEPVLSVRVATFAFSALTAAAATFLLPGTQINVFTPPSSAL